MVLGLVSRYNKGHANVLPWKLGYFSQSWQLCWVFIFFAVELSLIDWLVEVDRLGEC
jgi:hypothetical protein